MSNFFTKYKVESDDKIKVMIVDDSVVIRDMIRLWLDALPDMDVVACCRNGQDALDKIRQIDVDIVILDIEMPIMDGLTALPKLLKASPGVRVLMASTLTRRNAGISMQALALGATDYVPKPEAARGGQTPDSFHADLVDKMRAICRSGRKLRGASPVPAAPSSQSVVPGALMRKVTSLGRGHDKIALQTPSRTRPRVLAIGSSTGGPKALFDLFGLLKGHLVGVPVVVTQHMPPTFTEILAAHVADVLGQPCMEGETGMLVEPGHVYIAPGGKHMLLKSKGTKIEVELDDSDQVNFCKPAIDPMLDSLVSIYGSAIVSCILTGMGSDGRDGCIRVHEQGGTILAQDEETSVVWGMPGAVATAGICYKVEPIAQLSETIRRLLEGKAV